MTEEDVETAALTEFLVNQRASVRSIVAGLSEEDWHRSVVPSGWTPAGFVEHLGGAEYHWFQQVIEGNVEDHSQEEGFVPYDRTRRSSPTCRQARFSPTTSRSAISLTRSWRSRQCRTSHGAYTGTKRFRA